MQTSRPWGLSTTRSSPTSRPSCPAGTPRPLHPPLGRRSRPAERGDHISLVTRSEQRDVIGAGRIPRSHQEPAVPVRFEWHLVLTIARPVGMSKGRNERPVLQWKPNFDLTSRADVRRRIWRCAVDVNPAPGVSPRCQLQGSLVSSNGDRWWIDALPLSAGGEEDHDEQSHGHPSHATMGGFMKRDSRGRHRRRRGVPRTRLPACDDVEAVRDGLFDRGRGAGDCVDGSDPLAVASIAWSVVNDHGGSVVPCPGSLQAP
jgi:hypothetical protein